MSYISYDRAVMSQLSVLKRADITALSLLFQAFSNESRLGILNLLRNGPKNVGEISRSLGLEQTVVSHNLSASRSAGW